MPAAWTTAPASSKYKQQHCGVSVQSSAQFARERSSSNRNLPDANRLQAQPRRASDELAGSSSQRLSSRLSPAASRRSISVMNVGGDNHSPLLSRPSSRLGSQSSVVKRRDSASFQQQSAGTGSSPLKSYLAQQTRQTLSGVTSGDGQPAPVGVTPSGRRSSLAGIQTMIGYKTPKSSQSDSREEPLVGGGALQHSKRAGQKLSNPLGATGEQANTKTPPQKQRGSIAGATCQSAADAGTSGGLCSGSGSRRSSSEMQTPPALQRKGSFAMMTLRKLKRTMSLNKQAGEQVEGQSGSGGQRSRRSSQSSGSSLGSNAPETAETDLGVTRRVVAHTSEYQCRFYEISLLCSF